MSHGNHCAELGANVTELPKAHSLERAFLDMQNVLDQRGVGGTEIDSLEALEYRTSGETRGPAREHLLVAIEVDGIRDVVWYSPAAVQNEETQPVTIVAKPGLSEIVENGIGWEFHKGIANRNPSTTMLTHATEGFGPQALRCSLLELPQQSLDRMAERGRWLLGTYFAQERLVTVGTSMGTVIFHKLLTNNRLDAEENRLNIAANINYAPALVDPANVFKDMFLKFPTSMLIDGATEVLLRTNPLRLLELVRTLVDSKPSINDALPMARQIIDLLHGVSETDVLANTEFYQTATIVGVHDPVGQVEMWRRLPVAGLHEVKYRGHAIAVKPAQGAEKVTKAIGLLDMHGNPMNPDYADAA